MSDHLQAKLPKWPFLSGDVILLGLAAFIVFHSRTPLALWQNVLGVGTVAFGACLAILPFLLEYRAAVRLAEAGKVATAVEQIQNLESLAGQISAATAQWQGVHEASDKTAATANQIADRMSGEIQAFTEFMKKANESEKATLRLEAEKLRRAEGEWLQIGVRMLDHAFALHQAAVRAGRADVIEQLGQFQNACRDVARRIGLAPFAVPA